MSAIRPVAIFLAFALAYFLSALVRAITGTLSPTLTHEFGLGSADLGLLAGGYFLGFAALQLPLGTWLDRYGPRRVILCCLCLAVLGCLAFSWATEFTMLLAARVLAGVGLSACLMAPLTGYRRWFPAHWQLRANAWMLMAGSLGMVASTLPVQWLIPVWGWRPIFWALAGLLVLSIAWIAYQAPGWAATPDNATAPGANGGHALNALAKPAPGYAEVWRSPYFRRLAPLGFISYGGLIAMQTLWAAPWMERVAGYSAAEAASGLFAINVCMLLSFWSWGWLAPVLARRGIGAESLITWGLPLALAVLAGIVVAGPKAGAGAWAAFCVCSTVVTLAQPAVAMAFPAGLAGRALSAFNLLIFSGVFCVQWGYGLIIDIGLRAGLDTVGAFRVATTVFAGCVLVAYIGFCRYKPDNRERPTPPTQLS